MDQVTIGPFVLTFNPDGEDEGVGSIAVTYKDDEEDYIGTLNDIALYDWNRFKKAVQVV